MSCPYRHKDSIQWRCRARCQRIERFNIPFLLASFNRKSIKKVMERVTRIELVTEAWEAFVIPFHHTRHTDLDTQAALIPQAETIGLRWEWRALS
jgi:hypothetical protein